VPSIWKAIYLLNPAWTRIGLISGPDTWTSNIQRNDKLSLKLRIVNPLKLTKRRKKLAKLMAWYRSMALETYRNNPIQ